MSEQRESRLTDGDHKITVPWDGYRFNKSNTQRYGPAECYSEEGSVHAVKLSGGEVSTHACQVIGDAPGVRSGKYSQKVFEVECPTLLVGDTTRITLTELYDHPLIPYEVHITIHNTPTHRKPCHSDSRCYGLLSITSV